MVAGIQTFGMLINFHPHIYAIATDGAFAPPAHSYAPGGSTSNPMRPLDRQAILARRLAWQRL
jgi:hypothetical protein